MNIQDAYKFLNSKETGVIATAQKSEDSNPQPGAATVGFSLHNDNTLLIGTSNKTRKYANLISNPNVAFVVGTEGFQTVQIQGTAKEYSKQELADKIELHFEKVPSSKRFADNGDQCWFVITMNWLRFTDFTQKPPTFETKEF